MLQQQSGVCYFYEITLGNREEATITHCNKLKVKDCEGQLKPQGTETKASMATGGDHVYFIIFITIIK